VYTRAYPFLAFALLVELAGLMLRLPAYLDFVVALFILLALAIATAAIRRRAGRAPYRRERIRGLELAAFVSIPAVVALLLGDGLATAAWLMLVNGAILCVCYLVITAGLPAIVIWTLRNAGSQLAGSLPLLARALPLLLVFSVVLFINSEMWQVAAASSWLTIALVASLLMMSGVLFLALRLPTEVRRLADEAGAEDLSAGQQINVSLVLLVGQVIQLLLVFFAMSSLFIFLGALLVEPAVRHEWIHTSGERLVSFQIFGERRDITVELLQVSGFTAAITTLSFAISSATDSAYRAEFLDSTIENLRGTFEAHTEYLALRNSSD
jgi:hypothetical protein